MSEQSVTKESTHSSPKKSTILWILGAVIIYTIIQTLTTKGIIG